MYQVPDSKASVGQDKYDFKIGTKTHSIRKAKYVSGRTLIAVNSGNLEAMFDVFGADGTPLGNAVRDMPITDFTNLVTDWMADSDLSTGESVASAS